MSSTTGWTEGSFLSFLEENASGGVDVSAAVHVLYRIFLAWATFPYHSDEVLYLDWGSFIQAAGLLSPHGQSLLRIPGYKQPRCLCDAGYEFKARYRGLQEQLRLIFQALAVPPHGSSMQDGMADVDENEDLLDALAVCMDVGDEKFAYYPKDFASVMMSLPGSDSRRKLDWMMTWKDLETLIRLLVSIAGHWYDLNHGVHAAALKGNEQVLDRILSTFRLYGNGSEYGLSWSAFCTTAESHLPNLVNNLNAFLFNTCVSLINKKPFKRTKLISQVTSSLANGSRIAGNAELLQLMFTLDRQEALLSMLLCCSCSAARETDPSNFVEHTVNQRRCRSLVLISATAHASSSELVLAVFTPPYSAEDWFSKNRRATEGHYGLDKPCVLEIAPMHRVLCVPADNDYNHEGDKTANLGWGVSTDGQSVVFGKSSFQLASDLRSGTVAVEQEHLRFDVQRLEVWR